VFLLAHQNTNGHNPIAFHKRVVLSPHKKEKAESYSYQALLRCHNRTLLNFPGVASFSYKAAGTNGRLQLERLPGIAAGDVANRHRRSPSGKV
jgi:hypothetical protein